MLSPETDCQDLVFWEEIAFFCLETPVGNLGRNWPEIGWMLCVCTTRLKRKWFWIAGLNSV